MSGEKKNKEETMEENLQNENAESARPAEAPGDEAQKLRDEMLYLRAEFENTKRRLLREQETAIRYANEKLAGDLSGIVDLFERALDSGKALKENGADDVKNFVTGIEMTHRELVHLLNRFGVELVGTVGEKFDPSRHEAVSQSPTDPEKVDTVIAVVQKGSLLQGRLLKPAKVVVGITKE